MHQLSNEPMYRLENSQEPSRSCHDVVYTFDTTGSMNKYIESVKKDLHNRIKEIFKKYEDVQVAVSIRQLDGLSSTTRLNV